MSQTHDDYQADNLPVSRRGFLGTSLIVAGIGALPPLLERHVQAAAAVDTQAERTPSQPGHPLDPLTPEEITQAVKILRTEKQLAETCRFVSVTLAAVPKAIVLSHRPGGPFPRQAFLVLMDVDQESRVRGGG